MDNLTRTLMINTVVGGIMGYAAATLIDLDHPVLGIIALVAWVVGMINSLMSDA